MDPTPVLSDPDRRNNGKDPVGGMDPTPDLSHPDRRNNGKYPVGRIFKTAFRPCPNPPKERWKIDIRSSEPIKCPPMDDVYIVTKYGAFELYSIQISGGNVREIIVYANKPKDFPSDSLYQDPERQNNRKMQKVGKKSLMLCGPKYHLTSAYAHTFEFHCKSGDIETKTFVNQWDEIYGEDIVRTTKIADKFTVSYEWITEPVRANFQFSFVAEDASASTRHIIQNLNGVIQVSSLKEGTTRTLGLFDKDCLISGETLPLLRSSTAFPAGESFTVICNLSCDVNGQPKKIKTRKTFYSRLVGFGVFTEEGLKKAENDPKLHDKYDFGGQYPKLQMNIFWLTSLIGKSVVL